MQPSMVVAGDPLQDLVLGQAPRVEAHAVEPFNLQRAEQRLGPSQRLGHSVVPAIALAAHRAFHFEVRQELEIIIAGILATAI